MANLVRKTEAQKAEQIKGGNYIRLTGDLQAGFKSLMRDLGFDPENPRADKAVKQVGTMVASMGIELARACLATGTESLTQYVEKLQADAKAEAEAPAEESPEATPKA
jgi:hypothetical protein